MYIVKWLMGRPIAAILVLGVIAILLTLGAGEKKSTSIEKQLTTVSVSDDHSKSAKINTEKVVGSSSNLLSQETQDTTTGTGKTKEVVTSTSETDNGKSNTVSHQGELGKVEPFKTLIPGDSQRDEVTQTSAAEISDLEQLDSDGMLQMAREAYWNNGLDEAAQIYLQLIHKEPKVIEHKGELGNVYWRQGYPKKAAELYSEIAIPLIEEGSSDRVVNMIGFIQLFYPDRVSVIVDRLERIKIKSK